MLLPLLHVHASRRQRGRCASSTSLLAAAHQLPFVEGYEERLRAVLYGVQIMNEPSRAKFRPSETKRASAGESGSEECRDCTDLLRYYELAIRRMRCRGLPFEIPIVLFAWPDELPVYLQRMRDDKIIFSPAAARGRGYGKVIWDTHVYVCFGEDGERFRAALAGIPPSSSSGGLTPAGEFNRDSFFRTRVREEVVRRFYGADLELLREFVEAADMRNEVSDLSVVNFEHDDTVVTNLQYKNCGRQ